jgi:hypothetical protein
VSQYYYIHFDPEDVYREKHFATRPKDLPSMIVCVERGYEEVHVPIGSPFLDFLLARGGGWYEDGALEMAHFKVWRRAPRGQIGRPAAFFRCLAKGPARGFFRC